MQDSKLTLSQPSEANVTMTFTSSPTFWEKILLQFALEGNISRSFLYAPASVWSPKSTRIIPSLVTNRRKSASLICQISLSTLMPQANQIHHVPVLSSWKECSRLVLKPFWTPVFGGLALLVFPSVAHAFKGHKEKWRFPTINTSTCWQSKAWAHRPPGHCCIAFSQSDKHS